MSDSTSGAEALSLGLCLRFYFCRLVSLDTACFHSLRLGYGGRQLVIVPRALLAPASKKSAKLSDATLMKSYQSHTPSVADEFITVLNLARSLHVDLESSAVRPVLQDLPSLSIVCGRD
jgi:hypothetical protein